MKKVLNSLNSTNQTLMEAAAKKRDMAHITLIWELARKTFDDNEMEIYLKNEGEYSMWVNFWQHFESSLNFYFNLILQSEW